MDRMRRAIALVLVLAAAGIVVGSTLRSGPGRSERTPSRPARPLAITGTVRLPSAFGVAAAADGSLWIASYGNVLRVDPTTMTVTATIPVRRLDEGSIAAGNDVWVTVGSRHVVVEIDPETTTIVRTIRVPGYALQVAAHGQDAWVISAADGLAIHIDGGKGITHLSESPNLGLVVADGDLWVSESRGLVRVDGNGVATLLTDLGNEGRTSSLAYGAGSIWSGSMQGILRIDPNDGRVIARLPTQAISLSFAAGSLWVLTPTGSLSHTLYLPDPHHPSTVLSIDPQTNRIDGRPVRVGSAPAWLVGGSNGAWVAEFDPARLLRIAS